MKQVKHSLPEVKEVKMKPRPKNPWWRRGQRCGQGEIVNGGRYQHRHSFPDCWIIVRKWRGNKWFLYETRMCVYDNCGQEQVRHVKEKYCSHCGSLKDSKGRR